MIFFLRLGSLDIWPTRETLIKKKKKTESDKKHHTNT